MEQPARVDGQLSHEIFAFLSALAWLVPDIRILLAD